MRNLRAGVWGRVSLPDVADALGDRVRAGWRRWGAPFGGRVQRGARASPPLGGLPYKPESTSNIAGLWHAAFAVCRGRVESALKLRAPGGRWQALTNSAIHFILVIMGTNDRSSTSMNVSLPRTLRSFVDERVSTSSYTSASEYVRELIRKDREHRAANDRLEELLLEGLASGPSSEWTEGEWTSIRERVTKRLEGKQGSK